MKAICAKSIFVLGVLMLLHTCYGIASETNTHKEIKHSDIIFISSEQRAPTPEFKLVPLELQIIIKNYDLSFKGTIAREVRLYGNAPFFKHVMEIAIFSKSGAFINMECSAQVVEPVRPLINELKRITAVHTEVNENKLRELAQFSRVSRILKIQELSQIGDEKRPTDLPETMNAQTNSGRTITLNTYELWRYYHHIQQLCNKITGNLNQVAWIGMQPASGESVHPEKNQILPNGAIAIEWCAGFPAAFLTPLGCLSITRPEFDDRITSQEAKRNARELLHSVHGSLSFSDIEGIETLDDLDPDKKLPPYSLATDPICAKDAMDIWALVRPNCRNCGFIPHDVGKSGGH